MSTRQTGNRYENEVARIAEAMGYCVFAARGSRSPVDLICFEKQCCVHEIENPPPLVIQVGGSSKAISTTLNNMQFAPRPIGSRCIVAKRDKFKGRVRWTFHTVAGKFPTLKEAIQ